MTPREAWLALGKELQALIRDHRTSARRLSLALGQHPRFLSRALTGQRPLRMETVFEVLGLLGEHPYGFFRAVYPLAGRILPPLTAEQRAALDPPGLPTLQALVQWQLASEPRLPAAAYRRRVAEALRRAIRRHGRPLRHLSLELGLGPHALGLALRGNSQLTALHVLGVLTLLGADPGRVFFEAFLPEPASPLEHLERDKMLDAYEGLLRSTEEGFLARRKRKAEDEARHRDEPPPPEPPPDDEDEP